MPVGDTNRHIVAMGGGGFSMEPDNLLLDRYVLALAPQPTPTVCFIPTASGDSEGYIARFYAAFAALPCTPTHLSLFKPPAADLRSFVLAHDVLYVGGGNTRNMLTLWRDWGLDHILREAWERGIILAGLSAGAICWFAQGVTDSLTGTLSVLPCLGFLSGSACPHYDGEPARRPAYQRLLAAGALDPGYAIDDGVALHFTPADHLAAIVSSRPHARAYRLLRHATAIEEIPLDAHFLG